jgi:hypothetical protein
VHGVDRTEPTAASWTPVGTYPTRALAGFVVSLLEGDGLQARVVADDAGGVLPHLDLARGGVEVQVHTEDVTAATALLGDLTDPADATRRRPRAVPYAMLMLALAAVTLVVFASAFLQR